METEDFNIDKENARLYGYGQTESEDDDFDIVSASAKLYNYSVEPEEGEAKEKAGELVTEVRKCPRRGN
jgi:hypothetical protein